MDTDAAKHAYERLCERNEEVYRKFQKDFEVRIAQGNSDDLSLMQTLEKLVHAMNSDIVNSNLNYVGKMVESLDDEEMIRSKKANA